MEDQLRRARLDADLRGEIEARLRESAMGDNTARPFGICVVVCRFLLTLRTAYPPAFIRRR